MTRLAAVILAHSDPQQVRRLIAALDDVPVFLHCDRRTSTGMFAEITRGLPRTVVILPRRRTSLGSWSLVRAELDGLRTALATTDAEHVLVMSGSDYPLVSADELSRDLDHWRGMSRLQMVPVPARFWDIPRRPDGGMWRFRHRFVVYRDNLVRTAGVPLRMPYSRPVPNGLKLYASQQWKVLSRRHAEVTLTVLDSRPDLVEFWRTTYIPEESCIASVLGSPDLVGPLVDSAVNDLPWFIDWTVGPDHPGWLSRDHFDELQHARWARPRLPGHPDLAKALTSDGGRKLLARKFSPSIDPEVIDMIDRELRV